MQRQIQEKKEHESSILYLYTRNFNRLKLKECVTV